MVAKGPECRLMSIKLRNEPVIRASDIMTNVLLQMRFRFRRLLWPMFHLVRQKP